MTQDNAIRDRLPEILRLHGMWLRGEEGGVRADLAEVDLGWANLFRADLAEANLAGANLAGANLAGANLTRADLAWADFDGADLAGADLAWANLAGVNLSGANLGQCIVGPGKHATWSDPDYWALTARDTRGVRWLRYGCETHPLDYWDSHVRSLCEQHEAGSVDYYETQIRALVALCRSLDQ